jgi:hypothetical protein
VAKLVQGAYKEKLIRAIASAKKESARPQK